MSSVDQAATLLLPSFFVLLRGNPDWQFGIKSCRIALPLNILIIANHQTKSTDLVPLYELAHSEQTGYEIALIIGTVKQT